MVFLFKRAAEIQILKPSGPVISPVSGAVAGEIGSEARIIKNLRVQFKIQKGASNTLNSSSINIYNLNRDSRGFIEGKDNTSILNVGYGEVLHNIFKGTISRIEHRRAGADIISKIEVIDSKKEVVETHIEENFKAGTKTESVLRLVLKRFGLNDSAINKIISSVKSRNVSNLDKEYINGLALTGNFKEIMEKIMNKEGIDFSMQDGIPLIDKDIIVQEEAVIISKNTGMIGIPVKKEEGIEILSLIQPGIIIGSTINIISELINGFFKVRQIIYTGDTHQNKWEMKIIAQ